jgi:hypothetical protein
MKQAALAPISALALLGLSISTLASCGSKGAAALPCMKTVDQYCADQPCVKSWANVATEACTTIGSSADWRSEPCGGFNVLATGAVDTSTIYYYDPVSGNLVAVVGGAANTMSLCAAGPASFALPECAMSSTPLLTCNRDAGVDRQRP